MHNEVAEWGTVHFSSWCCSSWQFLLTLLKEVRALYACLLLCICMYTCTNAVHPMQPTNWSCSMLWVYIAPVYHMAYRLASPPYCSKYQLLIFFVTTPWKYPCLGEWCMIWHKILVISYVTIVSEIMCAFHFLTYGFLSFFYQLVYQVSCKQCVPDTMKAVQLYCLW